MAQGKQASSVGDYQIAERAYLAATRVDPSRAQAWHALGLARARQGLHTAAMEAYETAIRLQPDFAQAHNNLGRSLEYMGRMDDAQSSYERCLQIRPDLVQTHVNLGHLLLRRDQHAEAEKALWHALELNPNFAPAHHLRGCIDSATGRLDDAVSALERAEQLDPQSWEIAEKLGCTLWTLGRFEEAQPAFERALAIWPDNSLTLGNLALVLADLGRFDESLARFDRSLSIDRTNHEFHRTRALVWLLHGDYARGWPEFEWRFGCAGLPARPFPRPLWNGAPLGGRTIMIHCEQGLGDTFQFLRYLPLVKERGGRVVLVCQPAIKAFLSPMGLADTVVAQGESIPAFDCHAPLLSLPRIFGTRVDTIPASVPYIRPDPSAIARWRNRLAPMTGFKVGIAWQGSSKYRKDRERSFPLHHFTSMAALPTVQLISLQKGSGREQLAEAQSALAILDFTDELDEATGPFCDTAALMTSLDLVITPDTVHAHLAGALGVRTWVALSQVPHWPWLLNRTDSPWYPSARVFRQPDRGDWNAVFQAMTSALREIVA
jgi:Tfp pilus assembly protein PilF